MEGSNLTLRATWAFSAGRTTFLPAVEADLDVGRLTDTPRGFSLGGVFRLSGLEPGELIGEEAFLGRLVVYHEMRERRLRVLSPGLYVGASIEAGNVFDPPDSIDFDDLLVGGSVFVGVDTVLGPIQIGWGWTDGGRSRAYLSVGRSFL